MLIYLLTLIFLDLLLTNKNIIEFLYERNDLMTVQASILWSGQVQAKR